MKIRKTYMSILVSIIFLLSSTLTALAEGVELTQSTSSNGQNGTTLLSDINASGTWNRVYNWDIEKTVTPNTWELFNGDEGTSQYTVSVNKDNGTDEKYINGQVLVTNGGSVTTEGLKIVVKLTAPPSKIVLAEATVDTSAQKAELAPGESYFYNYRINYNGEAGQNYKVTADITINNHSGYLGTSFGPSPSGDATFPSSINSVVNDYINVDDTNGQSWNFNNSGEVSYEKTFTTADKGVYSNTATIRETGKASTVDVTVNNYELKVTEDASTSLNRKYNWSIDKTGDQTNLSLAKGQEFPVNYTVALDATYADSDWKAEGKIIIQNPSPKDAVINNVSNIVSEGIEANLGNVDFPLTIPAGSTVEIPYIAYVPDASNRSSIAVAELQNYAYIFNGNTVENGTTNFEGTGSIEFSNASITEIDKTVVVNDDKYGELGIVTYSENMPAFNYTMNIGNYDAAGAYEFINTASFVTNDTQTTGSDSWTVNINIASQGYTLTIGYWKNHAGFGPQKDMVSSLLPIWLGTAGDSTLVKSIYVDSAQKAVDILSMSTYGSATNGITKLYAQLLAAKLNMANGADGSAIADTVAAADKFLAKYNYNDWYTLKNSDKSKVNNWMTILDNYNNGLIGPGHASE